MAIVADEARMAAGLHIAALEAGTEAGMGPGQTDVVVADRADGGEAESAAADSSNGAMAIVAEMARMAAGCHAQTVLTARAFLRTGVKTADPATAALPDA